MRKPKAIFQLIAELRSGISEETPLRTLEELQLRVAEEELALERQRQVYEDEITILKRLSNISAEEAKFRLADLEREMAKMKRENIEAKVTTDSVNRANLELKEEVDRLERRSFQIQGEAARFRGQWVWNVETLAEQRELLKREVEGVEKEFNQHLKNWAETVVMMREKGAADKTAVKERLIDELYRLMAEQKRLIVKEERSLLSGLTGFIQNQIGGLGGTAQLLAERSRNLPKSNEADFIAQVLNEKALAIRKLEEGLKSFAELNSQPDIKTEKKDLSEFLKDWIAGQEAALKQWKLEVWPEMKDSVAIALDAKLLGQALFELVRNAAESGASGIRIVSETDPAGRWTGFTFADNGPGIAPHLSEKIFQPFFTTRKGAAGLGLCKVLRWIALTGGEVSLEKPQAEGRGAKFLVKFPVYESISLETP